MKKIIVTILCCGFIGCTSTPIIPSGDYIKVSRENPAAECENLGSVQGANSSTNGTIEQAIEDLKLDAARKGGNFVKIEATSALGTSVRGTVYKCP